MFTCCSKRNATIIAVVYLPLLDFFDRNQTGTFLFFILKMSASINADVAELNVFVLYTVNMK